MFPHLYFFFLIHELLFNLILLKHQQKQVENDDEDEDDEEEDEDAVDEDEGDEEEGEEEEEDDENDEDGMTFQKHEQILCELNMTKLWFNLQMGKFL